MGWNARVLNVAVLLAMSATVAWGTKPQSFGFSNQKDYAEGKFSETVVDSYGELMLGRSLAPVELGESGEAVGAFAEGPDGTMYAAVSGVSGVAKIYQIDADGKKGSVVYTAPKGFGEINAMTADGSGGLLVGLSGETAKLIRVDPKSGEGKTLFESKDVNYIWAILRGPGGEIYVGTGPHGKVYEVGANGEGEAKVVLESGQKNVMALAQDGAGNLVAGTDAGAGRGLVIRVDGKTEKPFVLLDAGKVDVTGIVGDGSGNLYVATAKAQVSPDEADESGMPEEPETKSKPGAAETEPVEPPDTDTDKPEPPTTTPTTPTAPTAPTQHAMLWTDGRPVNVCAAVEVSPSPDVRAMLKKLQAERKKRKGAPTLPGKGVKGASMKSLSMGGEEGSEDASSVYRIGADGRVTTLMQEAGMNYALLLVGGGTGNELLVGTGAEGRLYRYGLADQSQALVARVKEQQISALFADKEGGVFVGTGNVASVYEMGAGLAKSGTFTSQVLDGEHTANWGHAWVDRALSEGTKVTVATRSGNTEDVEANGKFWSPWSEEGEGRSVKIDSPAARYVQVRVTLTGDGIATPVVNTLRVGYQTKNLPPKIKSVSVDGSGTSGGDDTSIGDSGDSSDSSAASNNTVDVSWEANDPNGDTLAYRLYYKLAGKGNDPWTPAAKDVKETPYEWDVRAVPDGKYQVKVVASDSPDNPANEAMETARVSAPFLIDHTPPAIGELAVEVDGNRVKVSGEAKDGVSPVVSVRYQIDGQGDWQPASASDKIFDSPQEAFTIVTRPLSVSAHRITVRATDAAGNSSYKAVTVSVKS
ncbi:MAG TPA: hypothetical protein VM008_21670 [Phycisphaerae bacterium]|nr:hypothetical protein [Phycisphaerae bacterium]